MSAAAPVSDRRLFLRSGWIVAGRTTGALCAAAFLVLAAKELEPRAFGKLALLLGVATFLGVVAEGGLPLLVVERVAATPEAVRPLVRSALVLRAKVSIATIPAAVLVAAVTGVGVSAGAWYGLAMACSAVQTTLGSALRAMGHVLQEAGAEAIGRASTLIVGAAFVFRSPSASAVTAGYGIGGLIALIPVVVGAIRHFPRPPATVAVSAYSRRRALALGLNAVLVTLYNRLDLWLLAALGSGVSVGLYAAVYRFYEGLVLPGTAVGQVLAAAISRAPSPTARARLYRWYVLGATLLTSSVAVILAAGASTVVRTLFGSDYAAAVPALRWLCIASVPAVILSVLSPVTSLLDRRASIDIVAMGIVLSAGLNLVLVPRFEHTGAAAAMVVSQGAVAAFLGRRAMSHARLSR